MGRKRTNEEFLKDIAIRNPNIQILSEYKGTAQKVKYRFLKCNRKWMSKASHLLDGHGCKFCNRKMKTTEMFIKELNEISPDIEVLS